MRVAGIIAATSTLLAAVGVSYCRYAVSSIPRASMADQTWMALSAPGPHSQDKLLKIVQRTDAKTGQYDAVIEGIIRGPADGFYPSRPGSPPEHIHFDEDEVVEILSGTMGYTLEGEELATTTMVSIPVGKRHTIWNADPSTELHYKATLVNKSGKNRQGDLFFENLAGLSQMYGDTGAINPLQQFLTTWESGSEFTFLPLPVRLIIRYVIVPLAKLLGFKPFYPEYRSAAV